MNLQRKLLDLSPVSFVKLEDHPCHEYLAKEQVELSKTSFTLPTKIQKAAEVEIVPEVVEVAKVVQILVSSKRNRRLQSKWSPDKLTFLSMTNKVIHLSLLQINSYIILTTKAALWPTQVNVTAVVYSPKQTYINPINDTKSLIQSTKVSKTHNNRNA